MENAGVITFVSRCVTVQRQRNALYLLKTGDPISTSLQWGRTSGKVKKVNMATLKESQSKLAYPWRQYPGS